MTEQIDDVRFRMMTANDIGHIPIGCQGDADAVEARIRDLGSSAVLAFEGERHIAQLQIRRYDPSVRSPSGVMDPLYWGDFGDHAPDLPEATLSIFCYHVGQLDDTGERDEKYQGRGLGLALLDRLIAWAEPAGFEAIVGKAVPRVRPIMVFMGGLPAIAYEERGFEAVATWPDDDITEAVKRTGVVPAEEWSESDSVVACCVRRF